MCFEIRPKEILKHTFMVICIYTCSFQLHFSIFYVHMKWVWNLSMNVNSMQISICMHPMYYSIACKKVQWSQNNDWELQQVNSQSYPKCLFVFILLTQRRFGCYIITNLVFAIGLFIIQIVVCILKFISYSQLLDQINFECIF